MNRLLNRLRYWLELQFVRGAQYRLMVIAALIGLISIAGGAFVLAMGQDFETLGQAVWWAFLRLTDPGYLGDDVGTINRVVSTTLTVAGYVVFLGALVAVMTQWLNSRMQRLESGLTPVARNGHILILGRTNRTPAMLRELMLSRGRVRRFLRRHGARDLHVVVLLPEVNATLVQDLRDSVGDGWDEKHITLRSGNPLRLEHLQRVDHLNASAILIPGPEFGPMGASAVDTYIIKTLLSLANSGEGGEDVELPYTVAEMFDARKLPIARRAYGGPLELVASDSVISRLLAQNVRHPGLSDVYNEFLTHGTGSEIYIREATGHDGRPVHELERLFARALLLGIVRPQGDGFVPYLNPAPDLSVEAGDRFVLLAESYEHAEPSGAVETLGEPRGQPGAARSHGPADLQILIMGWNHKVPALIAEFSTYQGESFGIDVLSTVSTRRREELIAGHDIDPGRIRIQQLEGDYTMHSELRGLDLSSYDSVVIVGSDWLKSDEESDARTILGYLLLDENLKAAGRRPNIIVELLDPDNVTLLREAEDEVLISPLILSHMLAQITLRRELRAVFDELFTAGGAEITFRPASSYDLPDPFTFAELRRAASARGETALGLRIAGLHLNPAPDLSWPQAADLQAVTMVTYEE